VGIVVVNNHLNNPRAIGETSSQQAESRKPTTRKSGSRSMCDVWVLLRSQRVTQSKCTIAPLAPADPPPKSTVLWLAWFKLSSSPCCDTRSSRIAAMTAAPRKCLVVLSPTRRETLPMWESDVQYRTYTLLNCLFGTAGLSANIPFSSSSSGKRRRNAVSSPLDFCSPVLLISLDSYRETYVRTHRLAFAATTSHKNHRRSTTLLLGGKSASRPQAAPVFSDSTQLAT
jgi:hypothetical protein